MTLAGLDAYGPVPVSELGAYRFVCRYVSMTPGKCITAPEAKGYRTANKGLVLVYEDQALDGLGGASKGQQKAQLAAPILDAVGWPAGCPVYFAFDFSSGMYPGYTSAMVDCALAFAAGIGRPAATYCDAWLAETMHANGVRYIWQFGENVNGAEGPGPYASIWQGPPQTAPWGQPIDPDTALVSDFGAWMPDLPEDDMILTKLHDGQTVVLFPSLSGYRPVGPEWVAWFESVGYQMQPPLFQGAQVKNLGPFSAK